MLDHEWIRTGLMIVAYGVWLGVPLFGHARAIFTGGKSKLNGKQTDSYDFEYEESERNIKRRKVGGHYWRDGLELIRRRVQEIERDQLASLASGQEIDGAGKLRIIEKCKEVDQTADRLARYDGD